jgi:L-fucono-1,5-lactonase
MTRWSGPHRLRRDGPWGALVVAVLLAVSETRLPASQCLSPRPHEAVVKLLHGGNEESPRSVLCYKDVVTDTGRRSRENAPRTSLRLDAHQHFWRYSPSQHVWMTDEMQVLRRDFLPVDLRPLLQSAGVDGTVAVQARQMLEETDWLLQLADEHDFIKGVVGWVDLRSPGVSRQLAKYAAHPKLVGVRHVVHDEPDDLFMLLPEFRRGIARLRDFDLAYDLLLFPRHLPVAIKLVAEFPGQSFILDHIAKPAIRDRQLSPWKHDLQELARFPCVSCKLSGMVTEAKWGGWQPDDFRRYLDAVLEAFGPDRVMIGSDWPVCLLSSDYGTTMRIVQQFVSQFSAEVQEGILGGNCARVYRV